MTQRDTTRAHELWRKARLRDAWAGVPRDRAADNRDDSGRTL